MEVRFPEIPANQDWAKPLRLETTVEAWELIEGAVPANLDGTWHRAGPDRQYPPMLGSDIFIDGEGMAHSFRRRRIINMPREMPRDEDRYHRQECPALFPDRGERATFHGAWVPGESLRTR